jgi:transposase
MYSVDIYSRVRRACLKDGMSARQAARYFNKDRKTIAKMLRHALPPGYRRSEAPRRPILDDYVRVIDEILRTDKALIKKQRHTAKRIFERLRDEHGYAGTFRSFGHCQRKIFIA